MRALCGAVWGLPGVTPSRPPKHPRLGLLNIISILYNYIHYILYIYIYKYAPKCEGVKRQQIPCVDGVSKCRCARGEAKGREPRSTSCDKPCRGATELTPEERRCRNSAVVFCSHLKNQPDLSQFDPCLRRCRPCGDARQWWHVEHVVCLTSNNSCPRLPRTFVQRCFGTLSGNEYHLLGISYLTHSF